MGIMRKNNQIVEHNGEPVSAMANFMDEKQEETNTVNGAPVSPDPITVLSNLKSPKAEAGIALLAWAQARLAKYRNIAENNQAEINAVREEEKDFLATVSRIPFATMRENARALTESGKREKTTALIEQLYKAVNSLNTILSDAPGRLAQSIRAFNMETLKSCPPAGNMISLNRWTEHPALQQTPDVTRSAFKQLKEEIEYLLDQLGTRFSTPRPRSGDQQRYGFNVDRSRPASPSKSNAAFNVYEYDHDA